MAVQYAFSRTGIIRYAIFIIVLCVLLFIQSVYQLQYDEAEAIKMGSYVLNCLIHVCLLLGAYRKSRGFLLPYLILKCLGLSVVVFIVFSYMFTLPIVYVLMLLVICTINIFIWIGVYGFYLKLEHETNIATTNEINNKIYVDQNQQPPPYEKEPIQV